MVIVKSDDPLQEEERISRGLNFNGHPWNKRQIANYLEKRKEKLGILVKPNFLYFGSGDTLTHVYIKDGDFSLLPKGWKFGAVVEYYDYNGVRIMPDKNSEYK